MQIKRTNKMVRAKVSDLQLMSAYLILSDEGEEQILFINHDKGHCFVIQNYSNSNGVCCLHHSPDAVVQVIGKISDMNICDVQLSSDLGIHD